MLTFPGFSVFPQEPMLTESRTLQVISRHWPSRTIHEDEHTIVFLNLAPATRGHTCRPNLAGS